MRRMKNKQINTGSSIDQKNDPISLIICSLILTAFTVFGIVYEISSSETTWFHFLKEHTAISLLVTAATFVIIYLLLLFLFRLADKFSVREKVVAPAGVIKVPIKRWAGITGITLLLWLPYVVIVSPGTIAGLDYCWQLMQGCGVLPLSNHHPVFGSFIFGALFRMGAVIGGASGGILATAVFQCVLMAAAISYCVSTLTYLGLSKPITIILIAFYGLCPVIPLHAIWAVKDSIFSSIAILFFFGLFLRIYSVRNNVTVSRLGSMPALVIMAVLFSIYRNGTSIIAVLALLSVILYEVRNAGNTEQKYVKAFMPLLVFCIVISGWSLAIKTADVYPSDMRESVGMPVRQIMKSLERDPESFSEQDIEALERIYAERIEQGVTLSSMANSDDYGSLVADYIKPPSLKNKQDLKDFLRVWVDVGIKNPVTYTDEALRGSDAYWWPGYDSESIYLSTPEGSVKQFCDEYNIKNKPLKDYFYPLAMSLEKHPSLLNSTLEEQMNGYPLLEHFEDVDYNYPEAVRSLMSKLDAVKRVPVLGLLFIPGFYTWLLLIGLTYCCSRRKKYEIGLWPLLLIVVLACLSPVNGYMRYSLPVDLFSFILLAICMLPQRSVHDSH